MAKHTSMTLRGSKGALVGPAHVSGGGALALRAKDFLGALAEASLAVAHDVEMGRVMPGHVDFWVDGAPHSAMGHVLTRMGVAPTPQLRSIGDLYSALTDDGLNYSFEAVISAILRAEVAGNITQRGIEDKKRKLVSERLRELAAIALAHR